MKIHLIGALVALSFASCSDNPVTPEEHFEARGVIVRVSDSTIVRVDSNRVTGSIVLDSAKIQGFAIKFILEDGSEAVPEDEHDSSGVSELGLSIEIADTSVASLTDVNDHQWSMILRGNRADTTSLRVHLLHGGHDDFVSMSIPVVVRP